MAEEIYGFNRNDADSILRKLGEGARESENFPDPPDGAWHYIGKVASTVAAGGTGDVTVWDDSAGTATTLVIEDVKNRSASATVPSDGDTSKILGISRAGYSNTWYFTYEDCG